MKYTRTVLLPCALMAVTFFSMIFLKAVPVSRIWNGYTVLYVEKSLAEERVLSCLEESGCTGIISLGSQKIPFVSDFIRILPYEAGDYPTKRLSYFYDKSSAYRLYYIPRVHDSQAERALEALTAKYRVKAGIDGKQQFPWIVSLVTSAVFVLFFVLSKNKAAFAFPAVFPLALSFSQVFYPVAASCVLYMLMLYLAQRIWERKKAIVTARKNFYLICLAFFSLAVSSLCGWRPALLVVMSMVSSVSSLVLLHEIDSYMASRNSFVYTKIFQAPQLPLMHPKTAWHTLASLIPILILLASFVFSARFKTTADDKHIRLPVPCSKDEISEGDELLPFLDDYYKWTFSAMSFPFRNLNRNYNYSSLKEGDSVSIPRFDSKENGIVSTDSIVMKFDGEFRQKLYNEIDSLDYNAVEKLMKKQGEGTKIIYGAGNSRGQRDSTGLFLILACLFAPVLLIAYWAATTSGKNKK